MISTPDYLAKKWQVKNGPIFYPHIFLPQFRRQTDSLTILGLCVNPIAVLGVH